MAKKKSYMKYAAFGIAIVACVILVLLAVFFYPKTNSIWDDDAVANLAGKSYYSNMDCQCIGFTAPRNDCKSCTQYVDCYGIPVSCSFTCRQKVNGTWEDVSCGKHGAIPTPQDKESCESQGGRWGPIGLSPEEVCVMPTTDAGKVCLDSSECQSACVADLNQLEDYITVNMHIPIPATGKCTAWKSVVGCNAYVKHGVVNGVLCVD